MSMLSTLLDLFRIRKGDRVTFEKFTNEALLLIPSIKGRRAATMQNYDTAIRSLVKYMNESQSADNVLDAAQLHLYEEWLHTRGISRNTSSCYIRSLRALFYMLYPNDESHLFHQVFTGNTRTMKRALNADAVKSLIEIMPTLRPRMRMWADVFLFSILALGMPFVDLAHLRWSDIKNGMIHYRRSKTSQPIIVPVTSDMMQIMEKYRDRGREDLIFPILPMFDCPYIKYQQALYRYNKALKKLSEMAQLPEELTSYVARHTWATLASTSGMNVHHISQAMGHTDIKTTQIYLSNISTDQMMEDSLGVAKLFMQSKDKH